MQFHSRTSCSCPVCGSARLRVDEAVDRERILLGECGRCGHRWTALLGPLLGREEAAAGDPGAGLSALPNAAPRRAAIPRPWEGARVA